MTPQASCFKYLLHLNTVLLLLLLLLLLLEVT